MSDVRAKYANATPVQGGSGNFEKTPSVKLQNGDYVAGAWIEAKYLIGRAVPKKTGDGTNYWVEAVYLAGDVKAELYDGKTRKSSPVTLKAGDLISIYATRRSFGAITSLVAGQNFLMEYLGKIKVQTPKGLVSSHNLVVRPGAVEALTEAEAKLVDRRKQQAAPKVDEVKADDSSY
jgi:hypothetical protein